MTQTKTGITERLADYALSLDYEHIPPSALERTKMLFLDFLGVALGGNAFADSTPAFRKGVQDLARGAPGRCTVVGERDLYPAPLAALLNGAYAHSLDFDDTHRESVMHPGTPVFATLLALAEETGADGRRFLTSAVAGYEVSCKVGRAHGEGVHKRGFHPTATTGIFGAVAAGARLLGLDREALLNALGIAGSQSAGSLRFMETGAWNKRLHVGLCAHNALYALTFAQAGVLGAREPLEGRFGYFFSFVEPPYDLARALEGLGERYEVLYTAVKPYPSCRYNHGVIDAVLDLVRREGLGPDQVQEMEIALNQAGMELVGVPEEVKRRPKNIVDGQFSVFFAAASALLEGRFTWDAYRRLGDPQVQDLIARIRISLDRAIPALGSRVKVVTRDGRTLVKEVPLARGEPETFPTWEELEEKFRGLASALLPEEQVRRVAETVRHLEQVEDLRALTALLRP